MEPDGAVKMDGPSPASAMETDLKDHGTLELIRLRDEALADKPSHLILAAADPGQAVRPEALSLQIDLSENRPCPAQVVRPELFSLQVDLTQSKPSPTQAGMLSLQLDLSDNKPWPARPEDPSLQVDLSENKACRLPRWSRHETLVLIEAKKEGEARVKKPKEEREKNEKNRPVNESKWLFISAVCKKRGVDREANQCRKRWGNLFGDYKRIKDWQMEASTNSGAESFWLMRNDERKENKLPGSFDPEVFEALETFLGRKAGAAPALAPAPAAAVEAEAVFESGRPASEEGLVSDIEHPPQEEDATHDVVRGAGSSTPDPGKEQEPMIRFFTL
ncbi:hypothetical protein O6H91_16G064500 [Diphasiastrum complanatum]|uniref:Uncharacterized protein n=2 Tax=Diphasiastrum complanatum TaxID=34168 RepID=A0ACC2BCX1_DIPCM|nr:hypothetical protein O6H91_16G064500 [Diphasiastrum complanatum]KAJ7527638.1 hypothetical protein O6H91_16G064500 [Diphasiastrum complanatum]